MIVANDQKATYRLQGLSCANCAAKFERNIRALDPVSDVELNFGAAKVTVYGAVTREEVEGAGAFDGIRVFLDDQKPLLRVPFWQTRHARLTAMSLLLLLFGYWSLFSLGEASFLTTGLFAAAIVVGGIGLLKEGFRNLIRLQFDMKTLMTIAVVGAAVIGEWSEGAVVVFLFAISEALEQYSMDKARESIHSLLDITPKTAVVKRNGSELELAREELVIGDTLIVKPGQKIAMDGVVTKGSSSINEAAITGESMPVEKQLGDAVFAGTINKEGALEVEITKSVEDTTLAKIIHLVEEAQAKRAPSQAFIDVFAKYYTPVILLLAVIVAVFPPLVWSGDWLEWVYRGLTVLVVGCPCALVISTPVAIVTAIGNAAKQGVLIKGGVHLEAAGKVRAIAFDKTGTLTNGTPVVTDMYVCNGTSEQELLAIAVALETNSEHPLASSIVAKGKAVGIFAGGNIVEDFHSITGKGVTGVVDGQTYYVGKPALFHASSLSISEVITAYEQQAKTVVVVGTDSEILGLFAIADHVRPSAPQVIQQLRDLGVQETIMVTGDNEATAQFIGQEVGVSVVKSELMPEDKVRYVESLKRQYGNIAMVGDGVNDAPALASASIGIAMGGAGTDVALETADIALMADDLTKLPYTIGLSRKTLTIMKQNIFFALSLKIVALLLIIPGWLTLWMAIFADMGATLLVVLNSMRLLTYRTKR